jgi:hypothetical protein
MNSAFDEFGVFKRATLGCIVSKLLVSDVLQTPAEMPDAA